LVGLPSRWDIMNKITLGYQTKLCYIITAPSSKGKSLVLLNEAAWLSSPAVGAKVLYIDSEMDRERQQQPRLLSVCCGHHSLLLPENQEYYQMSPRYIKLKYYAQAGNEKQKQFIHQQIDFIKRCNLFWESVEFFDEDVLGRIIKSYIVRYGVEVVVIDYIKMSRMKADGLNETQKLGNLVDFMKNTVAKKWNTVVLSAAQTDQKDTTRPADSARIFRYSDFLANWQPVDFGKEEIGQYTLTVQKNREKDNEGEIPLNFSFVGRSSAIIEGDNEKLYQQLIR
jgi:replicative DNA helicase